MNEKKNMIEITPIDSKPDTLLIETAFLSKNKNINIYVDNNKIKMKSTVDFDAGLKKLNLIHIFNVLKELGGQLYKELDLISKDYTIVTSSAETHTKYQRNISFKKNHFFFKPYLNETSINILKEYFRKYGYPYLSSSTFLKLSQLKDNESYTFISDITFFVYYCISIYVICETHFLILHNKQYKIKEFLPIYIIDDNNTNKYKMWLYTKGITLLINDINSLINQISIDYSFYISDILYLNLDYYENILFKNYEYDLKNNIYITKDNREMKRKENKLYDTFNMEYLSYSEIKPTELLSKLIKQEQQWYNNIIVPTYKHLKYILSNSSKNSGYHYCIYCHDSFFGIGKECEKCKNLNSPKQKKKNADNKRYEKIDNIYKNLIELCKKTNKLNEDENKYLKNIKNISTFKTIYTKNKDKTKIDNLIKKMSNQ